MTDRSRRRPWLAALLALVVSGLGHAYLRRWARALGWYVAVTAAVVALVPDAAVDGLIAGDVPPLADVAPAVLVVAASVIDAYVTAHRQNREYERERRTASEPADREASAERMDAASGTSATTEPRDPPASDETPDADAAPCPHCGRETDPSFDFCQWCAEPIDE
ncbi:zinc ribbon domain-containing protein [Halorubrum rutilum]|uniref:Zinc ribbon domain-containing protein n=1 Tax=Halorubrum rutilum TaxID=1364933 RepID=A0ABD6AJ42_9EURY|nr:zinc ribbon domain-containing protein [Halorubrum rutilum]